MLVGPGVNNARAWFVIGDLWQPCGDLDHDAGDIAVRRAASRPAARSQLVDRQGAALGFSVMDLPQPTTLSTHGSAAAQSQSPTRVAQTNGDNPLALLLVE